MSSDFKYSPVDVCTRYFGKVQRNTPAQVELPTKLMTEMSSTIEYIKASPILLPCTTFVQRRRNPEPRHIDRPLCRTRVHSAPSPAS
jgi:hypothetical protein